MRPNSGPLFTVVKNYKDYYTGNAINGDVFILQHNEKILNAGVYADGLIIKLNVSGIFSSNAEVTKVNVDKFTGGNKFAVYRKQDGISNSFRDNVAEAMNKSPENCFFKYNCMEFVLELLDIPVMPTNSDCWKIGYGNKPKGFKVVKRYSDDYSGNAKLGDLFIVKRTAGYCHAGVCCHENELEIIQFTSNKNSRSVTKVSIDGFSRGWTFAIYRLKTGVPPLFYRSLDEAITKTPQYQHWGYHCIHFALELLFGQLEKTETDVESLNNSIFDGLK